MEQYQIASTYTLSHIIDEENNSICGTRFNAVAPIKKLKKQFRNYNEWRETSEYIINQSVENQNVSCLKCIAKAKKLWASRMALYELPKMATNVKRSRNFPKFVRPAV